MKKHILVGLLIVLLASISFRILYLEELKYALPTPLPQDYNPVPESSFVEAPIPELIPRERPVFIHFFNPECSCSKFNTEHFTEIARKYQKDADFFVIVQTKEHLGKDFFDGWGVSLPYKEDIDGKIALAYGVYSTPQAVIVDRNGQLFYRGNYNKSRYCSTKSSEYARISLESLLRQEKVPELPLLARIAYGCELPSKSWEERRLRFLDAFFDLY